MPKTEHSSLRRGETRRKKDDTIRTETKRDETKTNIKTIQNIIESTSKDVYCTTWYTLRVILLCSRVENMCSFLDSCHRRDGKAYRQRNPTGTKQFRHQVMVLRNDLPINSANAIDAWSHPARGLLLGATKAFCAITARRSMLASPRKLQCHTRSSVLYRYFISSWRTWDCHPPTEIPMQLCLAIPPRPPGRTCCSRSRPSTAAHPQKW